MEVKEALPRVNAVLKEVSKVIVGKKTVLEGFLICLLANGHLLIEDYPGLAKTLMAKTFAQTLGCKFGRIQFTSDLLPADVTGSYIYNQKSSVFDLRRGPIFCNILLADEINRAPPKTQSSILEAMEERQVTIEGDTQHLDQPFFVVATQNPIEFEGTYPLPEAQIDRFMMKLPIGYPDTIDDEIEIVNRRRERGRDQSEVKTVLDAQTLADIQQTVEKVYVDPSIDRYIAEIVRATRDISSLTLGSSPRGSLALWKLSRAKALLDGRDYVVPGDVAELAPLALAHRLILKSEFAAGGDRALEIVKEVVSSTKAPIKDD